MGDAQSYTGPTLSDPAYVAYLESQPPITFQKIEISQEQRTKWKKEREDYKKQHGRYPEPPPLPC